MVYDVAVEQVDARPTAVVAVSTTWAELPAAWPPLLAEVWACVRAGGIVNGCPNVMLYRDSGSTVSVEIGVELPPGLLLSGRVVASSLPAGSVARTVHRGPYSQLASAHQAVAEWCATNGYVPTRTRWEIYGPHVEDSRKLTTEVFWLLQPDIPGRALAGGTGGI